jgi:DnaK suppressor protein
LLLLGIMEQFIEKTRYSDTELEEFKKLIQHKLQIAREELGESLGALNSSHSNGDDINISGKTLEDGSATYEKEHNTQLAARQKKFIEQLEAAAIRIQNKTYGICRSTGKLIPAERLRAVPHTTQSMEAKLKQS